MTKLFVAAMAMLLTVSVKAYKVGDYYEKDGLKGIVVRVDDSGEHGLIMSLTCCSSKWLDGPDEKYNTNCFDEEDGEKNLASAEKYIKDNNKSWDMFPFIQWCRGLGPGWYPPAVDEIKDIMKAINGGKEDKVNTKAVNKISKLINKTYKGDALIHSKLILSMYSSTESEGGSVYTFFYKPGLIGAGKLEIVSWPKNSHGKMSNIGSRAVHKF